MFKFLATLEILLPRFEIKPALMYLSTFCLKIVSSEAHLAY